MHPQTSNVVPLPRQPLRVKLTDSRVRSQPAPARGSTYVYDAEVAGLALRITANGARTFVLYRRIKGRPERVTLGKVGMLSLGAARDAARVWIGRAAQGVDVREQVKRDRMRGATVAHLYKQWHDNAATRGLRSLPQDGALWARWVEPSIGRREAQGVLSGDVEGLSRRIGAEHPRTANKVVALLSRVFALALKRGEVDKNPAQGVARFPEVVRERVLSAAEVRRLLVACEREPEWGDYFRLLLMTGARRAALAAMRWCDVDLVAGVWTVPSWASKNKKPLAVALIPAAVAVLKVRAAAGLSPMWVFPSPTSTSGHLETPTKPWTRLCAAAGLQDVVIHDLRRTVGTLLAANGASTHVISAALGHLSTRSAEAYVHLGTAAVRGHLAAVTQGWGVDDEH